jgi:hypothetical protein
MFGYFFTFFHDNPTTHDILTCHVHLAFKIGSSLVFKKTTLRIVIIDKATR